MRKLLLLPFLLLCLLVDAQPPGYVPGTQVCWTINGFPHGYFKAAGNGERHILLSFTGWGETGCGNYQQNAPQNLLNDLGRNWDGRTVRAPGDTIVWEILTLPNYASYYLPDYARAIDTFFKKIVPIDTSNHKLFHVSGLSFGVGRFWGYLYNDQNHNSPYRHIFSTTISLSGQQINSTFVTSASRGRRNFVWVGEDDNGQTHPNASLYNFNNMAEPKRWMLQHSVPPSSAGHNSTTWDSCHSLKGVDTMTNTWLWMVTQPGTPPVQPPCPGSGGPAGYVPGTQVSWTYNGRSHGYFRAAGCGERHILVAFTDNTSLDSTNYQTTSPQKLLQDAGINWNGRTVRAPGDTVIWEVLTIPYTSGYWLEAYANDINYFFGNIASIDTASRNLFHIAGVGHGVGRMWGYLTNDQNHNSPYRNIFSTTIGVSTTWSNIYPAISAYSVGKRHWVWHGALDTSPFPPSASTDHYNALNGDKRINIQAGGGHNDITFDSCFSLAGSDSSNNRWLWMVTPPASGLRSMITNNSPAKAAAPSGTGELKAWPNPANGITRLSWNGKPGIAYRITVADQAGRVRQAATGIRGSTHNLDMSGYDKGVHFVRVEGGGEQFMLKLIRN